MDPHLRHSSRESHSPQPESDDMPACQSCPCDCIYASRRHKPGLRSGVVESLTRRIDKLERLLLEKQSRSAVRPNAPEPSDAQGCLYHAAILIANQTSEHDSGHAAPAFSSCGRSLETNRYQPPAASRKRKRQDQSFAVPAASWDELDDSSSLLPDQEAMDQILDAYFSTVHHWIPFIHQKRFRQRLQDPSDAPNLTVLLHGITVAAIRQVPGPEFLSQEVIEQHVKASRNVVLLNAMNGLSIENIQALALVAFESMGSANAPRTWAIVGSLAKSVEYLQLTVEPDESPRMSFMRPLTLLPAAQSPGEEEERRRVFWNVFLLDRFLSVTSGWNPSITAQDAHRRLPSNGKMWNSNERVPTPFFGILDRSTAKIGSLMHHVGPQASPQAAPTSPLHEAANAGAFAFRIEATESLSQVTSCFLLQDVQFQDREQVSKWLARFKELDVRLVHWKLFFPKRWSDSSVSSERKPIEMDPNLTLAHLTHNTSMILLHQHIGYPSPELTQHVKLPSACSAETCHHAAAENASIIGKFLAHVRYLVPAQVAFCAFIAARIMLVHWGFYDTALSGDFGTLIDYLGEMSRRWQQSEGDLDIAARYAVELRSLHAKCLADRGFCTQILLHPFTSAYVDTDPRAIHHPDTGVFIGRSASNISPYENHSPPAARHATTNTANEPQQVPAENAVMDDFALGLDDTLGDELAAVSNTLLGQQFAEMDRVFTLDGTDFTFGIGGWDALSS